MDDFETLSHRQKHDAKLRAQCPACRSWVVLRKDIELRDEVVCLQCDTTLEVTRWRPLTLSILELSEDDADFEDDD